MRQQALTKVAGYLAKGAELRQAQEGQAVLTLTVPYAPPL